MARPTRSGLAVRGPGSTSWVAECPHRCTIEVVIWNRAVFTQPHAGGTAEIVWIAHVETSSFVIADQVREMRKCPRWYAPFGHMVRT